MKEYLDMGHAEPVPLPDLEKPQHQVFNLPMHAVRKDPSTTTESEQCSTHLLNPPLVSPLMTPC